MLIVSEDNGPELGCYGDPYARTPNLDRLAAEGVRFNRAFVAQAGCSQSRASFLTGLYPHQHGQIGLATWGFRMYREDTPNLPRSLKAEVDSVESKRAAKNYRWGYPDYFFGKEPEAKKPGKKKRGKQGQ